MSKGSEWGKKKRKLLLRGRSCIGCGTTKNLEFAHTSATPIVPNGNGRGLNSRMRDILDNMSCYTVLCSECHYQLDKRNRRNF